VVWRELFALHLMRAASRQPFLVDLTLSRARDLAEDFARHGHRWTPAYREEVGLHLGAFAVAELDQRKVPEHPWPLLEVRVLSLEATFDSLANERPAADRPRWETVLRPIWMNMGGVGALPPHLVDTLRGKHRQAFPRAVEFVAALRGIDPNHLRREVAAWRKEMEARRARFAR